MKKGVFFLTMAVILVLFWVIPYSEAQQNPAPPLLTQPIISQPPAPTVSPNPTVTGTVPPPPLRPPSIGQIIPAKTLLSNLPAAVTTVQKLTGQLTPGKVWIRRAPAGEVELKAGILYQGTVVAVLHFSPQDGSLLPLGIHPRIYQIPASSIIQIIKNQLPHIIRELRILSAAEFREPEASWIFPVALGNTIVSHIKVYYDGIHIVPDYPANQEMSYYRQ